jgi:hypothetical protein
MNSSVSINAKMFNCHLAVPVPATFGITRGPRHYRAAGGEKGTHGPIAKP